MKYDDASWHYGSDDFPNESPDEYGGIHIALFLRWCFVKGWASELHLQEEPEEVQAVIDGTLSSTEFLFQYSDGKLVDESFNEAGNAFAKQYYGEDGLYLDDYAKHFGEYEYSAPESKHDFSKFSSVLEKRLQSGILTQKQRAPRWKF